MSNFFRKDLNLQKKWGHRLFISLFIISFVGLWIYSGIKMAPSFLSYTKSGTISQRVTKSPMKIHDLLFPGEEFDTISEISTNGGYDFLLDTVYCSSELYNHIEDIQAKENISNLYISDINDNNISLKKFSNYIKENNILCLNIDSFGGERKFLEPKLDYQEHFSFYNRTILDIFIDTLRFLGIPLFVVVPLFSIILFFYYKVILYVIYGKNKH